MEEEQKIVLKSQSKISTNKKYFISVILFLLGLSLLFLGLLSLGGSSKKLENLTPTVTKTVKNRSTTTSATLSSFLQIEEKILAAESVNANFIITTDKGNDLLVLVNKKIRLPANFIPANLVSLNSLVSSAAGSQMTGEAANALKNMFDASKTEGLNLTVVSAYRSYLQQQNLFNGYVSSAGLRSAETFSARPGHSQHQLGTTADLGAVGKQTLSDSFGQTLEGKWLEANSYKFGFVLSYPKGKEAITGYIYEPWHFRYIGVENAFKVKESGLILEEYLQKFGTW